jgi:hypothetical protein
MNAIEIDNKYPKHVKLDFPELYLRHDDSDIIFTLEGALVASWGATLKFEKDAPNKVKKEVRSFVNSLLEGKSTVLDLTSY